MTTTPVRLECAACARVVQDVLKPCVCGCPHIRAIHPVKATAPVLTDADILAMCPPEMESWRISPSHIQIARHFYAAGAASRCPPIDGAKLYAAWGKYVALFGSNPHGSTAQCNALAELYAAQEKPL